ncbi:MAG: carboxypeptidase-like regulatory domain-containing protein [Prevotella sp.]|nr:carboxypeptidase-like regulatory domain-containing protein [Prevotella sp.]
MTKQHTKLLLFLFFLLVHTTLYAQETERFNWKNYSDSTFVFEISNKEAEKFLKDGGSEKLMKKLLHTHVATFVNKWENPPLQGHFIYVNINKNKIDYRYAPVIPFQVSLFREYGLLTLQVIDGNGEIRKDAKIRIQSKSIFRIFDSRITFDETSKTYSIDDWSEDSQRLLTIELDKFKAIFDLEKHFVYRWGGGYNDSSPHKPDFYSYMLTDKNKYKPKEKIRFKSYALNGSKKPIKKDLEVWMNNTNYAYKKITTISPYNPGGFAGEIDLMDSLELKLDRSYNLQLRDNKGKIVANTNFRYEDYELYDNKMEVKVKSNTHYFPDTNEVEIKITDANGLIMPDMKSVVTITQNSVSKSYVDLLVAPFLVKRDTINLDNDKPTIYTIPADLFVKTDCSYSVRIETVTHDGQLLNSSHQVSFYKSYYAITHKTEDNYLHFSFMELGKEKTIDAELYVDDSETPRIVQLPCRIEFDQKVTSYYVRVPQYNISKDLRTNNIYHNLQIEGGLIKDSLRVELTNPLKLDVSWYIYEGNYLLDKGFGKELKFEKDYVDLNTTYYLEIFFTIGGEDQVYRKIYAPKKEYLDIDLDIPERIYPGQTIDSKIKVTDSRGRGVKDVDLTAFSYNSLLGYHVPDLPYYGNTPKGREQRDSYSIDQRSVSYSSPLTHENYGFWNKIMGLDKMEYYRFTYPDPDLHKGLVHSPSYTAIDSLIPYHDTFKYTLETPDGTTEFAPYVMKDGRKVEIYAIELDNIPVYFNWTLQPKGYSFLTESKRYHKIMLRLYDRAIIIDNYCFDERRKTIFSINLDKMPKSEHVRTVWLNTKDEHGKYHLTNNEKNTYRQLISEIPVPDSRYIYLKKDSTIKIPVYHPKFRRYTGKVLVGPLDQGYYQFMDSIRYFHEGGFSYKYADNVVYKYSTENLFSELYDRTGEDFHELNDFNYTPKEFERQIGMLPTKENLWFPGIINMQNTKIHVPADKEKTGIHSLIMRNRETGKFFVPVYKRNIANSYSTANTLYGLKNMNYGAYDVFLLYNSGKYLRYDSIPLLKDAYTELKMDKCIEHPKDSVSMKWLEYEIYTPSYTYHKSTQPDTYTNYSFDYNSHKNFNPANDVQGTILDETGEPIIGTSIYIKGTQIGTISDIDGKFVLDLHGPENTLVISFIGFRTREIEATRGSNIKVQLEPEQQLLEEVVVTGMGALRKSSIAGALAGSVAGIMSQKTEAEKHIPEEELEEDDDDIQQDAEDKLYQELLALDGLRTNFSDVGFWEPALVTNRKGEADFTITFPDNITQWDAIVYAMNRKLKTGTARKSIKSYKPLMGELRTPQFLIEGDSSNFVASIRNYTKDREIRGKIDFTIDSDTIVSQNIEFEASRQDKFMVEAYETDSLTTSYRFTRDDDYSDGEQRSIPILKQGTEIAEGTLQFLKNNDEINIRAKEDEEVHISITGKQLDIYMDAAGYLRGYRYACNEQLASKLIGLLNYELYQQFIGKEFKNRKEVNEIIKRLLKNQNSEKLWSWWNNDSNTSYWMSAHILRALDMAKKAGYQVDLNIENVKYDYMDIHTFRGTSLMDIDVLNTLIDWNTKQDYESAIKMFEDKISKKEAYEDSIVNLQKSKKLPVLSYMRNSYLRDKLILQEMRQKLGLEYDRTLITNNIKKDVLGSVRIVDTLYNRYWYYNNDAANIIAYRIIKRDSTLLHLKEGMQMYILGTKKYGWNTYQASNALLAILPDLLAESTTKDNQATVQLTGRDNKTLSEFPYNTILNKNENLGIKKESGIPLIYSAYTIQRKKEENRGEAFEITTSIKEKELTKGVPVTMEVEVKVKQENAEHVMIEIPIPAGCSYASKNRGYGNYEAHREYFKEKTVIFCELLPEKTYKYYIQLLPRYTGSYILNPAKVEMMYFPTVNANNDMRKISISGD